VGAPGQPPWLSRAPRSGSGAPLGESELGWTDHPQASRRPQISSAGPLDPPGPLSMRLGGAGSGPGGPRLGRRPLIGADWSVRTHGRLVCRHRGLNIRCPARGPDIELQAQWRSHGGALTTIAEGAALLKGLCGGAIEFRGSLSAADGAMHLGGLTSSATSGATCVGVGSHLLPVRLRSPGRALLHCQTCCATPDRQSGAAVVARRLARRPPGSDGGLEGLGGFDKGRSACSDGLVGRRADDRTVGGNDADCWRRVLDPEKGQGGKVVPEATHYLPQRSVLGRPTPPLALDLTQSP